MLNALTIDIEDYFQVHAFSDVIKYEDWGNYECRIERNTDRILEILDSIRSPILLKPQHRRTATHEHFEHNSTSVRQNTSHLSPRTSNDASSITHSPNNSLTQKVQGTFFVLGWIAERYPNLIRRIQKEGHEIACHGYAHKLIYTQTKEEFRKDVRKAKAILEDMTGNEVVGYRAPSYSITRESQWAFKILMEEGFKYDSSIFPIRHDFYGIPNAPRFPFIISLNGTDNYEFSVLNYELGDLKLITHHSKLNINNSLTHSLINSVGNSTLKTHNSKFLIEFPISTVKVFGQNVPISGGGYFRLFPYPLIKKGLKRINDIEKKQFIFYIHPWEFDFDQPRIRGLKVKSRLRHYVNLNKTENKFKRLLRDFQFSTVRDLIGDSNTAALIIYNSQLTT